MGGKLWTAAAVLVPLATVPAAWFITRPFWAWLAVMALVLLSILLTGRKITDLWRGAFIDERNKVSLSRFQTVLWTVLVVSAFLVMAIHNVRTGKPFPLQIDVPVELWILLGISVTSLVASGIIKQEKERAIPEPSAARLALVKAGRAAPNEIEPVGNQFVAQSGAAVSRSDVVLTRGLLAANDKPEQSSWLDMFRSEEVGAIGHLDLGKVQMFYFTIIIVFSYAVALGSLLLKSTTETITAFPALDESMIALLGISHAAYLANKTVSRTQT